MEKRGQVTIFIIIAIVVVALVAGFFLFREQLGLEDIFTPKGDEVYLFVEECIEGTGKDAIYYIGENGGYMFSPERSTPGGIPYYYFKGKNYMPSKNEVEEEISSYVNEILSFCTEDFIDFPNYDITEGEIKTETKIEENNIILNVEYPLSVTKDGSVTLFNDFKNIKEYLNIFHLIFT